MSWAVATLQPQGERKATENLTRQGYQSYSPRFHCPHTRREAPLFPGYLLILVVGDVWKSIGGTRGIASLLMNGTLPSLIPDAAIAPFREATEGGLVVLSRLPGARPGSDHRFSMGQRVRVDGKRNAFDGRTVIYDGMSSADRCFVLLSFMGRRVRAQVPEMDLSPL